ncbi:unnamed protein product, partial [Rotaria sp. Silwood2]
RSAINLWNEIESTFNEFDLIIGDTPITTDENANVIASLKDKIRLPCMAHRCSTALRMAWKATAKNNSEFDYLIKNISELRSFIVRSGGIQALPKQNQE